MKGVLTEQPDGPVFLILISYPRHGIRILAMLLGFTVAAAACRLGSRVPGSALTKAVFTITAGALVALGVRSQNLSWTFDSNLAFRRWLLGLSAVLLAAATVAALAPTVCIRVRLRQMSRG